MKNENYIDLDIYDQWHTSIVMHAYLVEKEATKVITQTDVMRALCASNPLCQFVGEGKAWSFVETKGFDRFVEMGRRLSKYDKLLDYQEIFNQLPSSN